MVRFFLSVFHFLILFRLMRIPGPVPVSAATKPPPAKRARKTFVSAISGDEESAVTHGTSDESGAGARRVRERREKRGRPEEDNDEDDQDGGMTDTQYVISLLSLFFLFSFMYLPLENHPSCFFPQFPTRLTPLSHLISDNSSPSSSSGVKKSARRRARPARMRVRSRRGWRRGGGVSRPLLKSGSGKGMYFLFIAFGTGY